MRSGQSGQALVFVALLSTVLIGFVGLVADGGAVAAQQELAQSAADGAALAGAYGIKQPGATAATATTLAGTVLASLGLPANDLSVSFLTSSGATTTVPAAAVTAQATVTDSRPTFFLKVLGVNAVRVTGTASAATAPTTVCALCVLGAAGTNLSQATKSQISVIGGAVVVNSTASPNMSLGNNASLSATAVTIAGGTYSLGKGARITPTPVIGAAAADAIAILAAPTLAGSSSPYTSPATSGSGSLPSGIYSSIIVNGSYSLSLTGIYVVTGPITINGGSLTASGALIYLTCPSYPTPCTSGTTSCGSISAGAGTMSITALGSGTYANLAVFADRNCQATNSVSGAAALTVTGTYYTKGMGLSVQNNGLTTLNSVVIVDRVSLPASNSTLTVNYSAAQNFIPKVALSQ